MDKSATQVTAAVPVALPVAADSSDIMTGVLHTFPLGVDELGLKDK